MKHVRLTAFFLALTIAVSLGGCGAGVLYAAPTAGELCITFLDVGQADCTILRTVDTVIVIDTGASGTDGAELSGYLQRSGIEKIDLLILSHPHEDHVGGVSSLLRDFEVAACLMPDLIEDSAAFREALSALTAEGCGATRAFAGVVCEYGDLMVEVLSPTEEYYSEVNDAGAVIRVRYGDFSALFTGDVSATVEEELVRVYGEALDADILKVAHHGSENSTGEAFLAAVTPQYAAISCAAGNEYGFPHSKTLARLAAVEAEVCRTDTDGTIVFSVKNGVISIKNKD